jgi:hypothetical protein
MLQTLHQLSKTTHAGCKPSMELATFADCVPFLLTLKGILSERWAHQVPDVPLSGTNERDREAEHVKKSVILKAGGTRLVNGLVSSLLSESASDLTLMHSIVANS